MRYSRILGKENFQVLIPLRLRQIARWKKTKEVSSCYKKLFIRSGAGDEKNDLVLAKIIERIFPEKEDSVPNVQLAFVIAVCVTILSPKHASIRLDKVALIKWNII